MKLKTLIFECFFHENVYNYHNSQSVSMNNLTVKQKIEGKEHANYIFGFYFLLDMLKLYLKILSSCVSVFGRKDEVNKMYFYFQKVCFSAYRKNMIARLAIK